MPRVNYVQVTNVDKSAPGTEVEHITRLGFKDLDTDTAWTAPQDYVWFAIRLAVPFAVKNGASWTLVEAYTTSAGKNIIRTKPDGSKKDNLLNLPPIP